MLSWQADREGVWRVFGEKISGETIRHLLKFFGGKERDKAGDIWLLGLILRPLS
jgi:hypothetical protein